MGGVGFVLIATEIWGREGGNHTSRWRPPRLEQCHLAASHIRNALRSTTSGRKVPPLLGCRNATQTLGRQLRTWPANRASSEVLKGSRVSNQPRVPTPPPVGHVENGWQWTGTQWVPFAPQRPMTPPGTPGIQGVPYAPQRPTTPSGPTGTQGVPFAPPRPMTPPGPSAYVRPATVQGKPKKPVWRRWWVWGIAVIVLLAGLSRMGSGPASTGAANAAVTVASQNPSASAASASAAAASSSAAEAKSSAAAASASAAQASASAAAASKAAASQAVEAARLNPASYAAISDRDWSIVQRDPDAHAGKKYLVYGCITQFDTNTGTDTFRANTGGAQQKSCWSYTVNTIVNAGTGTDLSKVAEEDLVRMYIEVVKAYTYTTTAGGSTTVPLVRVNMIQTTG